MAAAVAGSALIASAAWQAPAHLFRAAPRPAPTGNADALASVGTDATEFAPMSGIPHATSPRVQAHRAHHAHRAAAAPAAPRHARSHPQPQPSAAEPPGYLNPLRGVSGLIPERIDMGVDFGGSGPVYALGDAVVTNAESDSAGWPGGGWITYRLTDGPASGLVVYVAEDVTPAVQVGQHVTAATVVANMFNGGDGIETGWAMADGASSESEMAAAGGISGGGPFPTVIGTNFEDLLLSLGVPAANNNGQSAFGLLPAGYPASWG
jgi:murein DD-endopeptidase MepM/ murein hydrolase activator NlpD